MNLKTIKLLVTSVNLATFSVRECDFRKPVSCANAINEMIEFLTDQLAEKGKEHLCLLDLKEKSSILLS